MTVNRDERRPSLREARADRNLDTGTGWSGGQRRPMSVGEIEASLEVAGSHRTALTVAPDPDGVRAGGIECVTEWDGGGYSSILNCTHTHGHVHTHSHAICQALSSRVTICLDPASPRHSS